MNKKSETLMNLALPAGIEKLDRVLEGYQLYQVLLAALDLGVFEILDAEGPCDKERIADKTGINGMLARDFLATLAEMGFLSVEENEFANSKTTADFLIVRSPFYQGDWVRSAACNSSWENLTVSLQQRQPAMDNFNKGPTPASIDALGQRAVRGELQSVTEAVANWEGFYNSRNLLDLGGGHGLYAIALCQANPHLNGIIFDKPHVIDSTARYITNFQMQDRLIAQPGDICTDVFGSGYDIIIVSHLLYKFRKNLGPILDKACAALMPGGLLVTNHWFCAPGCAAESSGVRELAKALQSFGHPLCHAEDFDRMFDQKSLKILTTSIAPTAFGPSRLNLVVKSVEQPPGSACRASGCCS